MVSHSSPGGAQEIWANIAEGFSELGFSAKLCALYPFQGKMVEAPAKLPWTHIVPRRPTSIAGRMQLLAALVRFFRKERPDFVLTAMPAANVIVPLAAKLAGVKTRCVISHHTPVMTYNRLLNAADGIIGRLANVQTIVSVSDTVSRSLDGKSAGYRAKRRTIHNALPPRIEARLAALASTRKPASPRHKLVATGRLAAQKNYPVLIRAMALLPDAIAYIVGSGPDEIELKELAANLGVTDRMVFLGQLPREETLSVLAGGDVFVQPSLFEGHSLALIEAAVLRLPLVVSSVPVQVEGVTSEDGQLCGIVVDPHDEVGLANAIRSLLEDDAQYDSWTAKAGHLASTATFDRMMAAYGRVVGRE
nr:glycosyltransferase [Bosea sp. PAMC 26642]